MLKKERQTEILEIIQSKKYCSVNFLSKTLYAAPITIRRDLAEMEAAGLITKCHGGASIPEHENREIPFEVRDKHNYKIKTELAKEAAKLINVGDVVFIDSSSTAIHITDFIYPEQNLTVITNSTKVANILNNKRIRCYLSGGMPVETSHALVGSIAERTISEFYANICFFSTQGISEDGVISDNSELETVLRRLMIKNSNKSVYIYDNSKYGKKFAFKLCTSDEITHIITDR